MTKLRGKFDNDKMVDVILIAAIIVCASVIVTPLMFPRPQPDDPGVTLRILTQDSVMVQVAVEELFLSTTLAQLHNIVDIEWSSLPSNMWNDMVGMGHFDIIMGSEERVSQFGGPGYLRQIDQSIVVGLNETIAGVAMQGYSNQQTIWTSYGFSVTIFKLLVNETRLQENGLPIPSKIDDLLSPQYHMDDDNSSLIGLDIPRHLSIGHKFQHLVTSSLGWGLGVQKLTALYANSRFYENAGDAELAVRNGEIAIALTTFTGRPHDLLHPSLLQTHLENQLVIVPHIVGIDSSTTQYYEAEAFIEYLLSPVCQGIMLQETGTRMPIRREAFDYNPGAIDDSIYAEFNWTTRTNGSGVTDLLSQGDYALWLYMNSSTFSTRGNLTNCWVNIYEAYDNGSIDHEQFVEFRERMGEPLTIIDPVSLTNWTFSYDYALYVVYYYSLEERLIELKKRWKIAANLRYASLLNDLSEVI
jgi:ABC-type Fe3+ transport system substrate-binding protein